jgi:hypothetical protein
MNSRSIRILAVLLSLSVAPSLFAQSDSPEAKLNLSERLLEPPPTTSLSSPPVRQPAQPPIQARRTFLPQPFTKKFLLLSAGVYTAAILDMRQTLAARSSPWWYETDPLAKPFVRLPAPAYYATGLALATGVNWLSWKMGRSRRWRKLAPIPQVLSMTGNLYGFHTNRY